MEVRILGPLTVIVDGRTRPIGGRRAQTVLAVLALEANRCVPMERLIDAVWEHDPPPTARVQIQICVSNLRRQVIGAGTLHTHASGYLLMLGAQQLDAAVFERLARQGELDRALSAWHGRALAGLPGTVIESYRQQLEEKRLTVLDERIRRDLALGRHTDLVGELFKLVTEHPSRERLHAQLMLALYRSGRWVDALAAYRRAHAAFVSELGVEPTEELRRLQRAILTRDPCLDPSPPSPAALPALPGLGRGGIGWSGRRARRALSRPPGRAVCADHHR